MLDWGAVRGHLIPIDRFAHAGSARCRVSIAKAIEQIAVSQDLVTAAVAMKLDQKGRLVSRNLVGVARLT